MRRSLWQVVPAAAIAWGLSGCSGSAREPIAAPERPPLAVPEAAPERSPTPTMEEGDLSQLSVVEVTTVTTVQGSSGIFLSPRPQQERPNYVERADTVGAGPQPGAGLNRAKVDTALLFQAPASRGLRFEARLGAIEAQHYFPAVRDGRWPITLGEAAPGVEREAWTEWGGWRGFAGLTVEAAPAATLDYELLGGEAPLVLSAEGDDIVVTNRSTQTVAKTLLVYTHEGGIGISVVDSLEPGMRRLALLGPKEHPPGTLLALARGQLEGFFSDVAGPELGRAMAQAKSIPFLETLGLRLIYLLDDAHAPPPVGLPSGITKQRRFVLAQAEVLAPKEEAHVVSLLQAGALRAANLPLELGRFSHAKLEVAALRDETVKPQADQLREALEP